LFYISSVHLMIVGRMKSYISFLETSRTNLKIVGIKFKFIEPRKIIHVLHDFLSLML